MKKLVSIILLLALFLALAGCGEGKNASVDPTEAPTAKPDTVPTEGPTAEPTAELTPLPDETLAPLGTPIPTEETDEIFPKIVQGDYNVFLVTADGRLYGWGKNPYGQVGDGTGEDRSSPVHIADGLTPVAAGETALAIGTDGTLYGWGRNDGAQLGIGDAECRNKPTKIMENVKEAFLWEDRTFALTEDGGLYVWGWGTASHTLTPLEKEEKSVPRLLLDDVKSAEDGYAITNAGELYQLVSDQAHRVRGEVSRVWQTYGGALIWEKPDGGLYCEDENGNEVYITDSVLEVTAIWGTAWILRTDGSLYRYIVETASNPVWTDPRETRRLEFFMDNVAEFVGDAHVDIYLSDHAEHWDYDVELARKANGELWSWSYYSSTATGIERMEENGRPYLVAENVKRIVRNGPATYIITEDGGLLVSGAGEDTLLSGSLGTGDGRSHLSFAAVGLDGISAVFAHHFIRYNFSDTADTKLFTRAFAVTEDGAVYAWGYNGDGCLGAGTGEIVSEPVELPLG